MEELMTMEFTERKKKRRAKNLEEVFPVENVTLESRKDAPEGLTLTCFVIEQNWSYTYDELLHRVMNIMIQTNPEITPGYKPKFVIRPPQVVRIGTKKSCIVNFTEICKAFHRAQKHVLDYLLSELGTSGSINGYGQLVIKGRFQQKQVKNVLRRYIKEYILCPTCRSPNTLLQKESRICYIQCEDCSARSSVAAVKYGFQAVTGKRAAVRNKAII